MKITLNYEQIAEAIRNYVEDEKLHPPGTKSVVVQLVAEVQKTGWLSCEYTFEAEVTFKQ